MGLQRSRGLLGWLKRKIFPAPAKPDEIERAKRLIAAVDRGGIPLNPAIVNAIARDLGLEVSSRAPVEDTIGRIRQAVMRASAG